LQKPGAHAGFFVDAPMHFLLFACAALVYSLMALESAMSNTLMP
jgi:hypothetical protein